MNWLKNYALTSIAFFAYLIPFFLLLLSDVIDSLDGWLRYDLDLSRTITDVLLTFVLCQPTILLLVYRKRLAKIWKHLDLGRLD